MGTAGASRRLGGGASGETKKPVFGESGEAGYCLLRAAASSLDSDMDALNSPSACACESTAWKEARPGGVDRIPASSSSVVRDSSLFAAAAANPLADEAAEGIE